MGYHHGILHLLHRSRFLKRLGASFRQLQKSPHNDSPNTLQLLYEALSRFVAHSMKKKDTKYTFKYPAARHPEAQEWPSISMIHVNFEVFLDNRLSKYNKNLAFSY
jgi:hypothetical protein